MITFDKWAQVSDGQNVAIGTYYGLRTDSKPTEGVANGSCFLEMDTGKVYFFNAASSTWVEPGA